MSPAAKQKKCAGVAGVFHQDLVSKTLHAPPMALLIPYNLFRGMGLHYVKGTEYESLDFLIHCMYRRLQRRRNYFCIGGEAERPKG
jgi:hypothetical protein